MRVLNHYDRTRVHAEELLATPSLVQEQVIPKRIRISRIRQLKQRRSND